MLALVITLGLQLPARAALTWTWSYAAAGIAAGGTFTTDDAPDAMGFYQITGIAGTRNGDAITALQPAGTPIPGNAPFAVDNRLRAATPQLTKAGFGFATAAGTYANPFFADFLPTPGYLEFFAAPPFTPPRTSELPIVFQAFPVDEPGGAALLPAVLAALAVARRRPAAPDHVLTNGRE